jgi:unsaturated rhamnogalacturonyl hydrolase
MYMRYLIILFFISVSMGSVTAQKQDVKKVFKNRYIKKTMNTAAEWQLEHPKHKLYDWTNGAY